MNESVTRTGQTLLIVASTMLFAAFTSAWVVRRGMGSSWIAEPLPLWFWSTAVLVAAGMALAQGNRWRAAAACGVLAVTLQALFVAGLRMSAIAEAFRAVMIAGHAVHLLGASAAIWIWGHRARWFWRFAGGLWFYVLLIAGVWT